MSAACHHSFTLPLLSILVRGFTGASQSASIRIRGALFRNALFNRTSFIKCGLITSYLRTALFIMYLKHVLFPEALRSEGNQLNFNQSRNGPDNLEISRNNRVTSDLSGFSSRNSESTSLSTPSASEDGKPAWLIPVVISVGCVILVGFLIIFIHKKWTCFGLPLPFIRRKFKLAHPIKKVASSVRTSVSSTFSSFRGSTLSSNDKHIRKYAVSLIGTDSVNGITGPNKEFTLNWILDHDFADEFDAVKRADLHVSSVTVACKSENVFRNRFSNVLPYDKTRVVLDPSTSTNDYINANYVTGYRHEREFICTQGPLKQTVGDFWRMCWETETVAIIMLTKCYEKNQEKCYPYWQTGNSGYSCFGDIKLTLVSKAAWKQASNEEDERSQDHLWLVSELTMEKEGESKPRNITHIAFLSWPDFGVVSPECLIGFVRNAQSIVHKNWKTNSMNDKIEDCKPNGPVVIHCSAGVGRSGVFIAVDQLIRQFDDYLIDSKQSYSNKSINVFQIVTKMRRERMGMVQNLQQYALIYKCLHFLANDFKPKEALPVSVDNIQGSDWGLNSPTTK